MSWEAETNPMKFDPNLLPTWVKDFSLEEQEMVKARAMVDLDYRIKLHIAQTPEYQAYLVRFEARRWWRRRREQNAG